MFVETFPQPSPLRRPGIGRIELVGVGYRARDGATLVQDLDLTVEPGERLAVIGPNGAGKSTLLRLLAGRLVPRAGQLRIDGRDLSAIGRQERARLIAVLGQSDAPDPRLTLTDYVGLGRIPHWGRCPPARHRAVVEAACARLGLSRLAGRPLAGLSGGERQRAALARAIAQEPAILLLDEPTNHLDPRGRAELLETAGGLGVTVVTVLHDLALVEGFADRVAVLASGRIRACGIAREVLTPACMREVFGLRSFSVPHPLTGRPLLVFEAPQGESGAASGLLP